MNCLAAGGYGLQKINYDLRNPPNKALVSNSYSSGSLSGSYVYGSELESCQIACPPLKYIKLISRHDVWETIIENDSGITLKDVLEGLHRSLWHHLSLPEWWATTPAHRAQITEAYEQNCRNAAPPPPGLPYGYGGHTITSTDARPRYREMEGVRRIDWLLENTVFVGLEKVDGLIAQRYFGAGSRGGGGGGGGKKGDKDKAPLPDPTADVWVVKLASNSPY